MSDTARIISDFAMNISVCKRQLEGLSHEDCLLQPQPRGNCMNWVLGHMLASRNGILGVLGQETIDAEALNARYGHGSEPVLCDGDDVVSLADLVSKLDLSQERIAAALSSMTSDELSAEVASFRGPVARIDHVAFLCWHDSYHTGQTELLRQLAGTDDLII